MTKNKTLCLQHYRFALKRVKMLRICTPRKAKAFLAMTERQNAMTERVSQEVSQ
ncbi:hypothetical protein [Helicobacter rodentium]|uniref:hypothetical protein n=1 Tax=Helicobacter rodentium TaxID=59617 RepID=UPI002356849D|nr:hypothetical protein [Helicobacter rodentium]